MSGASQVKTLWETLRLHHLGDRDLTTQPYRARRAELDGLLVDHDLAAPWTLCPSTTDPAELELWLTTWTQAGIEGACYKQLDEAYLPGRRRWLKYRVRTSTEVVVGAVTGSRERPHALLVGTPGTGGQVRFRGRTTPLTRPASTELAGYLQAAGPEHPWQGRKLTGMFDRGSASPPILVDPGFVVEIAPDLSMDPYDRWRHPVRCLRPRPDLTPAELAFWPWMLSQETGRRPLDSSEALGRPVGFQRDLPGSQSVSPQGVSPS